MTMKRAQIIHNPSAGNADHTKQELLDAVIKAGYVAQYVSTDDEDAWKTLRSDNVDIYFLVGGDGTVRKLADILLTDISDRRIPIHLLPVGTANNIAKTLKISRIVDTNRILEAGKIRAFDCGRISGLPGQEFFLESLGFGIFPELIFQMKQMKSNVDVDACDKLALAWKVLVQIVKNFEAQKATIEVDGIIINGSFLLVELMNIPQLGPNLDLAPDADPGDGLFDLILIPEGRRTDLGVYLDKKINGTSENIGLEKFTKTIRARKIKMQWAGSKAHVDDRLIDNPSQGFEVDLMRNALKFVGNG